MKWNQHLDLTGEHSFLSPSGSYWVNYSEDKLRQVYLNSAAKERGTRLHALASELINLGIRLPRSKKTLNSFVNDAIGYHMQSEQVLYFSPHCFGTADAISFNDKTGKLLIHDLKTGYIPAHMTQLEVYASLFCLEYTKDPNEIHGLLRIYQSDDIVEEPFEPKQICEIMQKIVRFDAILTELDEEVARK